MCLLIESIKIKNGKCFNLSIHQRRMDKALNDLFGHTNEIVLEQAITIPALYQHGLIKCRILYDKVIRQIEFIPYTFPSIRSLQVIHTKMDYAYKLADRSAINNAFKKRGKADDVLFVKNGFITDSAFCNILLGKNGNYITPDTFLLNGVKRQRLLQEGKISEQPVSIKDLGNFDSLHLINAMIDIEDGISISLKNIYDDSAS